MPSACADRSASPAAPKTWPFARGPVSSRRCGGVCCGSRGWGCRWGWAAACRSGRAPAGHGHGHGHGRGGWSGGWGAWGLGLQPGFAGSARALPVDRHLPQPGGRPRRVPELRLSPGPRVGAGPGVRVPGPALPDWRAHELRAGEPVALGAELARRVPAGERGPVRPPPRGGRDGRRLEQPVRFVCRAMRRNSGLFSGVRLLIRPARRSGRAQRAASTRG